MKPIARSNSTGLSSGSVAGGQNHRKRRPGALTMYSKLCAKKLSYQKGIEHRLTVDSESEKLTEATSTSA